MDEANAPFNVRFEEDGIVLQKLRPLGETRRVSVDAFQGE
jgi:hypothetical protein